MPENCPKSRLESWSIVPVVWLLAGLAIGLAVGLNVGRQVGAGANGRAVLPAAESNSKKSEPFRKADIPQSEPVAGVDRSSALPSLEQLRALSGAGSAAAFEDMFPVVRELTAAECVEALKILRRVPAEQRRALIDALARRWAEAAPDAAFAAAVRERDNDIRNRLGYAAGAALARSNPTEALRWITDAKSSDLRVKTAEWVLPALAKTNPSMAAEYLVSNRFLTRHEHLYRNVAGIYGGTDPQGALAWAASIKDKRLRDEATKNAWSGWAEKDPQGAAAALKNSPPEKFFADTYSAIGRAWSRANPFAAMEWIETLADERAYGSFDLQLERIGTEGARRLIESAPLERMRNDLAGRVAQELARDNPAEAFTWAESMPEGALRDAAMEPAVREWWLIDPGAATEYITGLPESDQRRNLLSRAVQFWSSADPEGALRYVQQMPAGKERDAAAGESVRSIAEDDPQKAIQLLVTIEDPAVIGRVAERVVGTLARSDPATAVSLAEKIPAEAQPQAYQQLVRNWAFEHPKEAGEWLNSLAAGKARDSAVKAYVSVIDGMDPALATKWAHSISDPIERTEATFSAFNRWMAQDREAARTWVTETEIPEGFRPFFDRLLNDETYAREFR